MAKIEINARLRNAAGKGAARKVRNEKNIPAVVYGGKTEPLAIELDGKSFSEMIKKPGLRTKLFVIDTGKVKENAVLIDIQYHAVKDTPMHADFKRIDVTKPVSLSVPINLINQEISRGLKMGGALNFAVRSVLLSGKIDDIPEKIDVNLLDMKIMDTIHGRDLELPKGIELGLHQAELAFVTITGKMKEEAEAKKEEVAAAPAAAGKDAKKEPAKDAKK